MISTRCRSPTDSACTSRRGSTGSPYRSDTVLDAAADSAFRSGAARQGQRDVLDDGQRLEQREVLEHHADAHRARVRPGCATDTCAPSQRIVPSVGRVTP